LEVDTRKAIALLSYLAVSGEQPSREQLADLLWPDLDRDRARATLRRTLSTLRAGLSGKWLHTDRTRVWLNGDNRGSDIDQVSDLLRIDHSHGPDRLCPDCAPQLAAAAALFRGPFMAGFYLRDSFDFEDWQRREEEHQRRVLREVLDRLGLALAAGGRFAEAADAARRRIALDPLDESAHRQLMQCLVWNGDRAGALRQFRDCAAVLDRELGVGPLPETRALYEQILEEKEPPAPAGRVVATPMAAPTAIANPANATFVGRSEELASLDRANQRLIMITGEEGIGKTRLIDQWLSKSGRRSARSAPPPGASSVPYLAFRDALSAAAGSAVSTPAPSNASEAVRLLPELANFGFEAPGSSGDQRGGVGRFHAGVAAAFAHLLPGGVLVIDDAQWLDDSSMAMLAFLLTHPLDQSPQVLLAMREEELDASHPLLTTVRRLERTGDAVRISLGPLPPSDAMQLLNRDGGQSDGPGPALDQELAHRIIRIAGGNPLFVLAYRDAIGTDVEQLPQGLKEVVAARIDSLDDATQQVLSAAAILGSDFETEVLRAVAGRSEDEVVTAVETMVQRRLFKETNTGLSFTHEVIRRAVYDRLAAVRRRLLHSRTADALAKRHESASHAQHLELAGRADEAAIAHGLAGVEALAIFAYPEARSHLEAALTLGHPDRSSINLALGDAFLRMGDYGRALAAYEAVGSPGTLPGVEHRIGEVYRRLGRHQLAEASYAAAAETTADDALASQIAANRALVAHHQGEPARAREFSELALKRALTAADGATLAQAWNLAGMLTPDPEEAASEFEKALIKAEEIGRPDLAAAALNNLAIARRRMGNPDGAVEAAARALSLLEPLGDRHQIAALHSNLADALHEAGDEDRARRHLTESARMFAEVGVEVGQWEPEIWKLSEW
ncbi:MAG TPA: BTAD domain-containing putative transcriptional regulator, partial [Acidimicrobiia bacterium]|nr:BTAD domain-containing putative transcriptional regulator [Acidimicrobiia bacterium]